MAVLIGVTGSIAAGKSSLCRRLVERYGAALLDADQEIHRLYQPGTGAFDRIVAEFGDDVVGESGGIDRRILGTKVFGSPARMEALRTAIGDLPGHFMALLATLKAGLPTDGIGVFEAVNLFENEYMTLCDAGWLVVCKPETAIHRLVEFRGHSEDDARQRLGAAKPWERQVALADHVFHNDDAESAFIEAIDAAVDAVLAAQKAGIQLTPVWRSIAR